MVCDKFITWGWYHGLSKHAKGFIFRTVGRNQKYDKNGSLLFIQYPFFNRVVTWDIYGEYQAYFEKQSLFVASLDVPIKANLVLRLHAASRARGWAELEKWSEIFPAINIDVGTTKFRQLVAKSRLLVFGYDSTGFAEAMSLNIPCLIFLQVGFDQLNDYSKPIYSLLISLGIVHTDPLVMARKVNDVWQDVEGWWMQSDVQEARALYCDQYARTCAKPISVLKKILIE